MRIEVNGMRLPFRGGILKDEHLLLQVLEIDVAVEYDASLFVKDESLTHTIDYVELSAIVKKEVSQGAQLLESLALRMDSEIRAQWESIQSVDIRIRKKPSLGLSYDNVVVHLSTP